MVSFAGDALAKSGELTNFLKEHTKMENHNESKPFSILASQPPWAEKVSEALRLWRETVELMEECLCMDAPGTVANIQDAQRYAQKAALAASAALQEAHHEVRLERSSTANANSEARRLAREAAHARRAGKKAADDARRGAVRTAALAEDTRLRGRLREIEAKHAQLVRDAIPFDPQWFVDAHKLLNAKIAKNQAKIK